MFRISFSELEKLLSELVEVDTFLKKCIWRLSEISSQSHKDDAGYDSLKYSISRVEDMLFDKRKVIYELSIALSRMKERYKRAEEYLIEEAEGGCVRDYRKPERVSISFSESDMELIKIIKV